MTSYSIPPDPDAEPEAPTPQGRLIRTVLQTCLAVCAALPAAVVLLPLDADQVAWPIGIAGALVIVVSALQNGLEETLGRK